MMEISRKSNFRFKALVIGLLLTILTSTCSTVFAGMYDVLNLKDENEAFINRTVKFSGPTYWKSNGTPLIKGMDARQFKYGESEEHEGVIVLMDPFNTYKFYIAGKGWIKEGQIISAKRFVTLQVGGEKVEGGLKGMGYIKVDGEYLNIESTDAAIVRYDAANKALVAEGAGTATVKINQKNGDPLELVAVVVGDPNAQGDMGGLKLELKVAEDMMSGTLSATLKDATVSAWNQKLQLHASGNAEATLAIQDGKVNLTAGGSGEVDAKVVKNDQTTKEIFRVDAEGKMTAVVDPKALTVDVKAEATEKLTILEKLTVALKEKGHLEADTEHVKVDGDASVSAGKDGKDGTISELGSVHGELGYKKGDTDPKGLARAKIFGKEFTTGEQNIPIVSGLKTLIGKIRK